MNIIKLSYEYNIIEDETIKYYGNKVEYRKVIDDIIELNTYFNDIEIDYKDIIKKYIDTLTKKEIEEIEEELNQWNDYNLSILDYINQHYELEILELLFEDDDFLGKISELFECQFGTVGYSTWSYYLALNDIDAIYIRDLWEGWNFYTLELIQDDDVVDCVGCCYINNDEDLKDYVLDCFGIKDFYLADNQEATYIDHPKVSEIVVRSYSYKIIE